MARLKFGFIPIEGGHYYNEALDERYKRWLLEDIQKHHYIEIKL